MNDRRVFLLSFSLSIIFHFIFILYIFAGGQKTDEKKIVWVSFVSQSDVGQVGAQKTERKNEEAKSPESKEKTEVSEEGEKYRMRESEEKIREMNEEKAIERKSDGKDEPKRSKAVDGKVQDMGVRNKAEKRGMEKSLRSSQQQKEIPSKGAKRGEDGIKKSMQDRILGKRYRSMIAEERRKKIDARKSGVMRGGSTVGSVEGEKDNGRGVSRKFVSTEVRKDDDEEGGVGRIDRAKLDEKLAALMREFGVTAGKADGEEGREGDMSDEDMNRIKLLYARLVRSRVEERFEVPPSLRKKELICTVFMKIDVDGGILELKIDKSSGDQNFDTFVLRSIMEAAPFPPPPSPMEFIIRFSNMR